MSERRYSDEEVAAIFKWAAEAQHTSNPQLPSGQGMTLSQLQEIGREVGIAPEQLTAASKAIDLAGRESSRKFLGLPIGVGFSVDLHRKITDAEWEQFVVELRETFDARGKLKQEGSFRQWTNGNLQALIEPTPNGDRIRFKTVKGDAQVQMVVGIAMVSFSVFTLMMTVLRGKFDDIGIFASTGMLGTAGLAMLGYGGFSLPKWARLRKAQMERLATRLALGAGNDRSSDR